MKEVNLKSKLFSYYANKQQTLELARHSMHVVTDTTLKFDIKSHMQTCYSLRTTVTQ